MRFHWHKLASFWIACLLTALSRAYFEGPKTAQLHNSVIAKRSFNLLKKGAQHGMNILMGDFGFSVTDVVYNIGLSHFYPITILIHLLFATPVLFGLSQHRKFLVKAGFLSCCGVAVIETLTGSGVNQFDKFGESSLSGRPLISDNGSLKGLYTGSHAAFCRTVACTPFQVLMMPLHGSLGIRQYCKPHLFHRFLKIGNTKSHHRRQKLLWSRAIMRYFTGNLHPFEAHNKQPIKSDSLIEISRTSLFTLTFLAVGEMPHTPIRKN